MLGYAKQFLSTRKPHSAMGKPDILSGFVLLGFIGITLFALSGLIHLVRMAVEAIL